MIDPAILKKLNAPDAGARLAALEEILPLSRFPEVDGRYINNHIHTTFSFSPYSPTAAVYAARAEGLCTAGIIDHDSIAGAREFLKAAGILQMPATIGMECRVRMDGTPLADRRLNSPDQKGIAYMTIQSVPHDRIDTLDAFFAPLREKREARNRKMTDRIRQLLPGIELDYDADIRPLSEYAHGGSVTERHLMYALALKMIRQYGKGESLVRFLSSIGISLSEKQRSQLMNTGDPVYAYDLLGILKSNFIPKIYIDADEECPALTDIVRLCRETDSLLCYAYLGDVTASVTGDKKAQKFEDDYLPDVFETMKEAGVPAITYMPTRNTREQLITLRGLCERYAMIQVSGEDINSPRQSFVIHAMEDPLFANLIDSTWKLIRHEKDGTPIL